MNTGPDYNPQQVPDEELGYLDDAYDRAQTQDPDAFSKLPDGDYRARITGAQFRRSKNGEPMLTWDFDVIGGEHAGRTIQKNTVVKETTLGIIKSDLAFLGITARPLSAVRPHLEKVIGVTIDLRLQTNTGKDGKEYSNTYFQKIAGAKGSAPAADEDSIPF